MLHPYLFKYGFYMDGKTCSFIGHRKIDETEDLKSRLQNLIEGLILDGFDTFSFGSKSDFNTLCHGVVTNLRKKYPRIKRVVYPVKSEGVILEKDKERLEKIYFNVVKKEIDFLAYEEGELNDKLLKSGKASYVERNRLMIDESDFCVFYYDQSYRPERKLYSKKSVNGLYTSQNSGTALAYSYAVSKNKPLINVFTKIKP